MRTLAVFFLGSLLAACYPDLDWREVRSDEGGFSVLLPSKPRLETQSLPSPTIPVNLRQWSSKARNTAFAVGYADLAPDGADTGAGIRDVLLRNISGKVIPEVPVSTGSMPGKEILADGRVGNAAVRLRLQSFSAKGRLYQLAVLGPPGDFQPSEIETFFLSFKADTLNR